MQKGLCGLLAFALAGCASSGFDRFALRQELRELGRVELTDGKVAEVLQRKPRLSLPFRLGVFLRPQADRGRLAADNTRSVRPAEWRWDREDRQTILFWTEALKREGIISDAFIIPSSLISGSDLEGLRQEAAENGAGAILVISGISDVERYANYLSLLYVSGVGLWMVPGTNVDSIFLMDGAMWDVKRQYLYLRVESEKLNSSVGPAKLLKDEEVTDEAKRLALDSFGPELQKRIRAVAQTN
jgi:rhombotail lipoprotein